MQTDNVQNRVVVTEPKEWRCVPLSLVADVYFSNVDKRTRDGELPVRLCNYIDVYKNDYIVNEMPFMRASATGTEIARFGLRKGDVIITKDSETPDDIGIPAVVDEAAPDLVCGYHLALIRPNKDEVDPTFLAKQLAQETAVRFFSCRATGSTRYGLANSAVGSVPLLLPPLKAQQAISSVVRQADLLIKQSQGLITKYQRIRAGLIHDLLSRGIDDQGCLRDPAKYRFKQSVLGPIPEEWSIEPIVQVAEVEYGISAPIQRNLTSGVPMFALPNVDINGEIVMDDLPLVSASMVKPTDILRPGDLLFNWRNGSIEHLGKTAFFDLDGTFTHVGFLLRVRAFGERILPEYLVNYLRFIKERGFFKTSRIQVNNTFNSSELKALEIKLPPLAEQRQIVSVTREVHKLLEMERQSLRNLQSVKTGLMQDLLNGKVSSEPLWQDVSEDSSAPTASALAQLSRSQGSRSTLLR